MYASIIILLPASMSFRRTEYSRTISAWKLTFAVVDMFPMSSARKGWPPMRSKIPAVFISSDTVTKSTGLSSEYIFVSIS